MRTRCEVYQFDNVITGDYGREVRIPSVRAVCSRCGHTTESGGTSEASVKRCLALMREECPRGRRYFYTGELSA